MRQWIVDTNVPIVANGRGQPPPPSIECRRSCIRFLQSLLKEGRTVIDSEGVILTEYRRHLRSEKQGGTGDQFYHLLLQSNPTRVEHVFLEKAENGEYLDFPSDDALADFDLSDRKFVALAIRSGYPVANATDSDWIHHKDALEACGLRVEFLCGEDPQHWFTSDHQ